MLRSSLVVPCLLCASLAAQSFSYPDFSSTAQLNLLGNSQQAGNAVRLTANASNQTGWMWRNTPVPILNGFDTTFTFRIAPPPFGVKAEGMALVIHELNCTYVHHTHLKTTFYLGIARRQLIGVRETVLV